MRSGFVKRRTPGGGVLLGDGRVVDPRIGFRRSRHREVQEFGKQFYQWWSWGGELPVDVSSLSGLLLEGRVVGSVGNELALGNAISGLVQRVGERGGRRHLIGGGRRKMHFAKSSVKYYG